MPIEGSQHGICHPSFYLAGRRGFVSRFMESSSAHRTFAAGRQVGFPEFHGAVSAGDKRGGLGGESALFFFQYGSPILTLRRLSGEFLTDFRGKRMLHGVEHMVGQYLSWDADVGKVVVALRIFPLNAETVGLVDGLLRKQESKRSQEKKST